MNLSHHCCSAIFVNFREGGKKKMASVSESRIISFIILYFQIKEEKVQKDVLYRYIHSFFFFENLVVA